MTNNSRDKLNRELSYPSVTQTEDGTLHIAYTHFRQAIKYVRVRPEDPLGWIRLGEAQEKAGQLAAAEASMRRAVAVAPGYPEPAKALDSYLGRHRSKE